MRWQAIPMLVVVAVVAGPACGKRKQKQEAEPAPAPAAALDDAAIADVAARDAAAREPEPVVVTPEMRRAFNEHLARGRALEKGSKYAEASAAFELALGIIPEHPTALSELGWTAYKTGDLARSRQASADSARLSHDPHLKAASLYNLGRALEDAGERDAAIETYRESLRLRSHPVVAARLKALGSQAPGIIAEQPPCAARQTAPAVCPCLEAAERARRPLGDDEALRCDVFGAASHDLRAWRVQRGMAGDFDDGGAADSTDSYYLAHQGPDGIAVVAVLGRDLTYNALERYGNETLTLAIDKRPAGATPIYWVTATRAYELSDRWETRTSHDRTVSLCREAKGVFACPIQVPVKHYFSHDAGSDDTREDFVATYGVTPPIERAFQLDIEVDATGAVRVIRAQGAAKDTALYVGTQPLW